MLQRQFEEQERQVLDLINRVEAEISGDTKGLKKTSTNKNLSSSFHTHPSVPIVKTDSKEF